MERSGNEKERRNEATKERREWKWGEIRDPDHVFERAGTKESRQTTEITGSLSFIQPTKRYRTIKEGYI
tara:strand:+ start:123 stop:329 length:207 start_codon:yes stop_codon:yes gene_type:complete